MQIDLALPPGLSSHGTKRQSRGRWRSGNHVRFFEGDTMPIGGWYRYSNTAVTGAARGLETWMDNGGLPWAAVGTHTGLHVMTQGGTLHDITPAGLAPGRDRQTTGGGFGAGTFGTGAFGAPRPDDTALLPATTWSFGLFGEDLIACANTDGTLYSWSPDPSPDPAQTVALANAPTDNRAVVVTHERAVMAIGCNGDPRCVAWSDVENATDWTPTASNRAGDFTIRTNGRLHSGLAHRNGVVIFSETDVWLARYLGAQGYGFTLITDGSGSVSPNAAVLVDQDVIWMGPQGFWSYSGFAQPLACEVYEDVFETLNREQVGLVHGFHNSAFGEVWWFYPSKDSTECDRYVCYSYKERHWSAGALDRLAAYDVSPFPYVLMTGADGFVWAHEVGDNREGVQAFLEGGPISLGEATATAQAFIPDARTLGDMDVSFTSRLYPHGGDTAHGPYDATAKTDIRFTGREVDVKIEMAPDTDWRVGVPMLRITPRGGR